MTYQETLDYLFNSLPMYHRIGKAAYKADITNTVQLMEHLGNPERKFRSIHVAGTNGKGSVSHTLASVLMQAGYKVGLYTSPHLVDFRERIRINGQKIPEQQVTDFVCQHKAFMQGLDLSFFEMTVGLAFDYFAREQVDVAVVEVGMGGRLDSTNVVMPDLCVITNIGFDHTQFLGDTLPKIAAEKAGIIKPGVPVVIGESHPETRPVFQQKAEAVGAPICFADDKYRIVEVPHEPTLDDTDLKFTVQINSQINCHGDTPQFSILNSQLKCPLSGSYQLRNLATLFQALEILPQVGYNITPDNIEQGIARVVSDTGLHGRWEKMDVQPLTVCETAHNADGVGAMLEKLSQLPYRHLHLIYGCVNDKDYRHILRMLPQERTTYYYTQPSVPRALPVVQLAEAAQELGMAGESFPTVGEAIEHVRSIADKTHDLVLVTGSIFLVADAVGYYASQRPF
ncbi:MAG: bifunctional folylpolyglutamate synthase/dihydrofolate synthase [Bacteroidales bacterium]|nr:bifunctional folylpolyglutamate synthase/dihydrofolate synthase [Bacteroidales bacterium]